MRKADVKPAGNSPMSKSGTTGETFANTPPESTSPETNPSGEGRGIAVMETPILQALQQPVLLCDGDNRIILANYAAETYFGASTQVLTRLNLEDLFAFGSPILQLVKTVRSRLAPMTEYRVSSSPLRSSRERETDVFASPVPEVEGAVSLLFQERTMADKIDRQLVSRGAVRSATGLAAMLAHEIKNPLAGIRGAAQLLEQTVGTQEQQFARLIRDETDRIVKLVDRIEVFGDERPVQRTAVNIHAILDRVKLLTQSASKKPITISETYDPSLPPVFGNEDQLIQVFINLMKNAMEAIEKTPNPRIEISTAFRPGIKIGVAGTHTRISLPLEIVISDNGPGVTKDLLPFLFDPFVTSKENGSGLGLALVAKIIADHGGTIECESRPGQTRFRTLLPMAPARKAADDSPIASRPARDTGQASGHPATAREGDPAP